MIMAATRKSKRRHVLQGLGLAAQTVFATPSLLIDPTFSNRLGSFLAGPRQTPDVPTVEQPETLTERLIRQKRLLRLSQAKPGTTPGAPGLAVQQAQAPAGTLGGILGGPVAPHGAMQGQGGPTGLFNQRS